MCVRSITDDRKRKHTTLPNIFQVFYIFYFSFFAVTSTLVPVELPASPSPAVSVAAADEQSGSDVSLLTVIGAVWGGILLVAIAVMVPCIIYRRRKIAKRRQRHKHKQHGSRSKQLKTSSKVKSSEKRSKRRTEIKRLKAQYLKRLAEAAADEADAPKDGDDVGDADVYSNTNINDDLVMSKDNEAGSEALRKLKIDPQKLSETDLTILRRFVLEPSKTEDIAL